MSPELFKATVSTLNRITDQSVEIVERILVNKEIMKDVLEDYNITYSRVVRIVKDFEIKAQKILDDAGLESIEVVVTPGFEDEIRKKEKRVAKRLLLDA